MQILKIACRGAISLPLSDLHILQGDLKDLSLENYQKLKNQMLTLGFSEPISVWKYQDKWWSLNGTQRIRTLGKMREEGYEIPELPVSVIEADTMQEAKKKILSLTSQFGNMTDDGLYEFMTEAELGIDDIEDFRFPEIDHDKFKYNFFEDPKDEKEDEVPQVQADPKTKLGDLWELGEHRLLCGDATEHIDHLIQRDKIDMVYTDPPYGMNANTDWTNTKGSVTHSKLGNHGLKHDKITNDHRPFDPSVLLGLFESTQEVFLFGADYYSKKLPDGGSWVVWDKRTTNDGRVINQLIGVEFELCWSKKKNARKIARVLHSGLASVENDKRQHPTQKPVKLAEWFFDQWGKTTKTVADLYGGSGSTLIACEKTNRKCYMMEIEPKYVRVIIDRWEQYTGKKAELIKNVLESTQ